MTTIIFTGGGTGGHVFPGIAVYDSLAAEIRRNVRWIGSYRGVERRILENRGIPYAGISTGKLRRYLDIQNVFDLFRVVAGVFQAYSRLKRWVRKSPEVDGAAIFSKGGFVAVPVVIAAAILRIPVVIHESDSDAGLATRITAPFARTICVPYPDTVDSLPPWLRRRCIVTGNPVRQEFSSASAAGALDSIGLKETSDPVVLVTGGSLGALQLNTWIREVIAELSRRAVVIHQTGARSTGMIDEIAAKAVPGRYFGAATFDETFPALLKRADLVVARAGAGTIWEIAVSGRPAILVPLSAGASRGDQIRNAERYARSGAAVVLDDPETPAATFLAAVDELLDAPERRRMMAAAARRWAPEAAAGRIAAIMVAAAEGDDPGGSGAVGGASPSV
ncbi:MAG: undecaprenyldiphospho-muramoylpentapeptide beta-N-acetylglucosaminyltransferase [Alkalispirochaeta sp.]